MAAAWRHQAITWTNADLSLKVSRGIHLKPIWQEVPMNLNRNMCLEITNYCHISQEPMS